VVGMDLIVRLRLSANEISSGSLALSSICLPLSCWVKDRMAFPKFAPQTGLPSR